MIRLSSVFFINFSLKHKDLAKLKALESAQHVS